MSEALGEQEKPPQPLPVLTPAGEACFKDNDLCSVTTQKIKASGTPTLNLLDLCKKGLEEQIM